MASETLYAPRANTTRFCPYHGGQVLLADCPVLATSKRFNQTYGSAQDGNGVAASTLSGRRAKRAEDAASAGLRGLLGADDGDDGDDGDQPPTATVEAATSGQTRRMAGEVLRAGQVVTSRVDNEPRLILALGPGYLRSRLRSAPELAAPAQMAASAGGAASRPARACPLCRHPLPATIDYRDPFPVALVGHAEASKTTTLVALIEEAGQRGPEAFGARTLAPTEATMEYLYGIKDPHGGDETVFDKFRSGTPLPGTDKVHHPPMEFLTTLGPTGPQISLLLQDASGEELMNPEDRLFRTPAVLWSDAIMFIYNPEHSPRLSGRHGQRSQASILNGLREDLEARGPLDASGQRHKDPPLLMVVSKADLLEGLMPAIDIDGRTYTDQHVKNALRQLGDAGVISAAERFPTVRWLFAAPMPDTGAGPQGIVELFRLLLQELK